MINKNGVLRIGPSISVLVGSELYSYETNSLLIYNSSGKLNPADVSEIVILVATKWNHSIKMAQREIQVP